MINLKGLKHQLSLYNSSFLLAVYGNKYLMHFLLPLLICLPDVKSPGDPEFHGGIWLLSECTNLSGYLPFYKILPISCQLLKRILLGANFLLRNFARLHNFDLKLKGRRAKIP
ncbi:hypothetical protein SAY87_028557 [Trapa incisa]|uniref:Uncharacterized protein n=1 Tax=Trapa incisa TaxID=236973 RepID=A0AAN7QRQ2_9MYRT|nr:hypothetical protein SAY87_028557 [Trapa incisa]